MKIKTLLFILCLPLLSFSQELSKTISEENKQLLAEFKLQEQQRLSRINTFLKSNPNQSTVNVVNNKTLYLYDIIDNSPIYKSTDNLNAARATKTVDLQPGGSLGLNLKGTGMTVGVWDEGPVQSSHPEFLNAAGTSSRVTVIDNTDVDGNTTANSHGTHVAGTVGAKGADSSAKGMAIDVSIKSYNWSNDESEIVTAINDATNPIILSNHSYGVPLDSSTPSWYMGAYVQDARDIDNIHRNNPQYLLVASAGNAGNTSYSGGLYAGYDKLTGDKNAKNSLVIANANPAVAPLTNNLTSLTINNGSSEGPTDDLRIKPDIAADGTNLKSTVPTNAYATFSGTSMAAPNATGTLVLLQEYYNNLNSAYMLGATLKALVCHTAIDDSATAGPDPVFGWGFLNARAAAETIAADNAGTAVINELSITNSNTYTLTFSAQAGSKLSATICWTDMPGGVATNGVANDQTPRLINDLDLRIAKDGTTYLPWRLDYNASSGFSNSKADNSRDNIERIDIDAPTTGTYTLTVTHKGVLQGPGLPLAPKTQNFSLILTGNNVSLSVAENKFTNFNVYPNPAKDLVNVSFKSLNNDEVKLTMIDIQGRVVLNQSFTPTTAMVNQTLNTSNLNSGMYILKLSQGNVSENVKIIVE